MSKQLSRLFSCGVVAPCNQEVIIMRWCVPMWAQQLLLSQFNENT